MGDGDLVRQARAGCTAAYAELVRRWAARITALCHARVGRADAAADLAQEALLRGFRGLASLTEPEKFGAWLCGIAQRTCLDWLKSRERTVVPFSALGTDFDPNAFPERPAPDGADADEVRQLLAEVEALPEEQRQVVMLYYYEDTTYRDVAQMLGVSSATVNARLTKARALLRARLSRRISPLSPLGRGAGGEGISPLQGR